MKKRNVATCIILSIFTFGIYGIYWFVKLTDDSNEIGTSQTASGGMAVLFTILISASISGSRLN